MDKDVIMAMRRLDELIKEIRALKKSIDRISEIMDVDVTRKIRQDHEPGKE